MKRIEIEIEKCQDCTPFRKVHWCVHPVYDGKLIKNVDEIPDWCPLPNASEWRIPTINEAYELETFVKQNGQTWMKKDTDKLPTKSKNDNLIEDNKENKK